MTAAPSIGVVVPAHQAADTLGPCLEALAVAGFAPGQITVSDDGSRDATARIAAAAGVRLVRSERARGAAAARNAGAADVPGEVILFVDADVCAAPDARRVIARRLAAEPGTAAVFGAYDDDPAAPGTVSRFRNLLHRHVHLESAGEVASFWTGLGAVRRPAFEAAGRFDEGRRMMEDVAFGMTLARMGERIVLDPALQGKHLKRWTLAGMARTDLHDRAIPWAELLIQEGARLPEGFNVGWAGRASVLAVAASLIALPLLAWPALGGAILALAAAALTLANRRFLRGQFRDEGPPAALAAVPLLWLHYLCGGLGFAWVRLRAPRRAATSAARTPRDRTARR